MSMTPIKVVPRVQAIKAYVKGEKVYIGYLNKHDGAFYSTEQFPDKAIGNTPKERFLSIANFIRYTQLPHTRIKYAVQEDSVIFQG